MSRKSRKKRTFLNIYYYNKKSPIVSIEIDNVENITYILNELNSNKDFIHLWKIILNRKLVDRVEIIEK